MEQWPQKIDTWSIKLVPNSLTVLANEGSVNTVWNNKVILTFLKWTKMKKCWNTVKMKTNLPFKVNPNTGIPIKSKKKTVFRFPTHGGQVRKSQSLDVIYGRPLIRLKQESNCFISTWSASDRFSSVTSRKLMLSPIPSRSLSAPLAGWSPVTGMTTWKTTGIVISVQHMSKN